MKTTLNIDDTVMRRLKQEAARRGTTMSALVEAALRRFLEEPQRRGDPDPLPTSNMGAARIDLADRGTLHDLMEGR